MLIDVRKHIIIFIVIYLLHRECQYGECAGFLTFDVTAELKDSLQLCVSILSLFDRASS